jgi:hypothetical protein
MEKNQEEGINGKADKKLRYWEGLPLNKCNLLLFKKRTPAAEHAASNAIFLFDFRSKPRSGN